MRKIIFHYHFFKNAGTSIDELLKSNFPGRWVTREFEESGHRANRMQVAQWAQREKQAIAFSSHTAMLPPPVLNDVQFFPILFVRHPIDRIASAYFFENRQGGDGFGAVLARNTTLAGYIEIRLSLRHDRQCRDFHVSKLSAMFAGQEGDELSHALRAIETLPFVGIVEDYEKSVQRLGNWLAPHFPDFNPLVVARNVSPDRSLPLEGRLKDIRAELGEDGYRKLCDANQGDFKLFDTVCAKWLKS